MSYLAASRLQTKATHRFGVGKLRQSSFNLRKNFCLFVVVQLLIHWGRNRKEMVWRKIRETEVLHKSVKKFVSAVTHRADVCCHSKHQWWNSSIDCFWPEDRDWKTTSMIKGSEKFTLLCVLMQLSHYPELKENTNVQKSPLQCSAPSMHCQHSQLIGLLYNAINFLALQCEWSLCWMLHLGYCVWFGSELTC